ncbi:FkbM family methyltransferase [Butyrivibrio sp. LC3010]|uniref:FkbM family methyltransferase n=1 Tax=Butyrivibrio sp. LC3010 TaxID=1280680 RepID=UPI000408B259|nr:FkbM family methyltransferase [Butyrivibrio sp. LC3010]
MDAKIIELISNHLQDDFSRQIFDKRVKWSETRDNCYIDQLLELVVDAGEKSKVITKLKNTKGKLVIRGAGNEYRSWIRWIPDLKFEAFCDSDPVKIANGNIYGKPVISNKDFYENYEDYFIAVNSTAYNSEILSELKNNGVDEKRIINLGDVCKQICGTQYFEKGIIAPVQNEVFVDGGAYDGATCDRFIEWCSGNYNSIYAFEPDKRNYERLNKKVKDNNLLMPKMHLINRGLWSKETTLSFSESGTQGSHITEGEGTIQIKTAAIDDVIKDDKVTFIKLDVEGAEKEALLGAEEIIRRDHPRMAISIYHKPEDIWELPELVLSLNNDYKLWLRHYQLSECETILYAL